MFTGEGQILFILIGSTVIICGLIGYFLVSLMRQFRLYRQQQEGYNRAKLEALEQERQLIAADLHDDIGPLLSATLYKLGEVHPAPEREIQLLAEARQHIDGIYSRLRELSVMLVPRAIEKKGPLYALEEFAETYLAGHDLQIDIRPLVCPGLDGYHSLHLFRILQEILHNTVKHALARRFSVKATLEVGQLEINTEDDGIGFDPGNLQEYPGLGLQHLQIRARMIGAILLTESWPGRGTRYRIQVPITDSNEMHEQADPHIDG